jgi:hypothetical protein
MARNTFAALQQECKISKSQYARGLPDRAINTLKADHSPRLARWIVIQRERL